MVLDLGFLFHLFVIPKPKSVDSDNYMGFGYLGNKLWKNSVAFQQDAKNASALMKHVAAFEA